MKLKLILRGTVLLIVSIFLYSCYSESTEQVQASFEYQYLKSNQTIPVLIKFINESTGGDSYKWEFEGGNPKESTEKNPGQISYVKQGKYTVKLTVKNIDGEVSTTSQIIEVLDAIKGDFNYTIKGSNYPPVATTIINNVEGAGLTYYWKLEGSQLKEFIGKTPTELIYDTPGKYNMILLISNGQDTIQKVKTLEVLPDIDVDFDWEVAHSDYDYQTPVKVLFKNTTSSADSYTWHFQGSDIKSSTAKAPEVVFNQVGKHSIELIASNDKKSKSIVKNIDIHEDTNLYVISNIKLGNVFSHNTSEIPALYSTVRRQNFYTSEVDDRIAGDVDIVFTGMTSDLSMSRFISPTEINNSGLLPFSSGQKVKVINSQELCNCGVNFTIADFELMKTDKPLQGLSIVENSGGKQFFNNRQKRVVLFETGDGRKGAIYVKEFVILNPQQSYILCDIKVQKAKR